MNLSEGFAVCSRCIHDLNATAESFSQAYIYICAQHLKGKNMTFRGGMTGSGGDELRVLEEKGYVISTEKGAWDIEIKPLKFINMKGMPFFCARIEDHAEGY